MEKRQRLWKVLGIVLGVSAALAAALMIAQTAAIYREGLAGGGQMYTAEIIAARFSAIAVPVLLFCGLTLFALLLRLFLPQDEPKTPPMTPETRLAAILPVTDGKTPAMQKEEARRRRITALLALLQAGCVIRVLAVALRPERFSSMDLETEMAVALPQLLLPVAAALLAGIVGTVYLGRSRAREAQYAAAAPRRPREKKPTGNGRALTAVRLALLAAAVAFIVLGILNGGMYDVLVKAINICTECVGLG